MLQSYKGDENLKKQSLRKAAQSQKIVLDFLIKNGFTVSEVSNPSANGIDIVAIKNGKNLLVEVKSVIRSSRSWNVKKIHPKCDYVAIVMPSGHLHFESAFDWRKLTDKNGARSISRLVNFYNVLNE